MRNDLQQPPHSVTLSELMNPWYKGAQPCLVTGIRTSFHVACWWRGRGLLTLWAARILLKFFHLAMPSLLAYEWFELVERVTVSFPVLCAMGCRQSLIEDSFYRWRLWENGKCKDDKNWLQILLYPKSDSSYCLLRVKRLKWYRVLLLINSSFNHNAMPDGKFAQVMNSC